MFFANRLQMQPWDVWHASIIIMAPVAFLFTYGFVRHFRPMNLGGFVVLTLAIPYWLITIQFPSDTTLGYPFVAAAYFFLVKRRLFLPLAAGLLIVAARARMDALPLAAVAVLILWIDRPDWRRWFVDSLIFGLSYLVIGQAVLMAHGTTLLALLRNTLSLSQAMEFTDWRTDIWSKTFTFNLVLVSPFILFEAWRVRHEPAAVGRRLLWVLPVLMYVYLWRNLTTSPRYLCYLAPFLMILTYDGFRGAVAFLRERLPFARCPWVVPALTAFVLFDPTLHLVSLKGNSDNLAERTHRNIEKMLTGNFNTGLLFGFNAYYGFQYDRCFAYVEDTIDGFLRSPYPRLTMFVWGNDTENNVHQLTEERLFAWSGVRFGPETSGPNLPFKVEKLALRTDETPELEQIVVTFTAQDKQIVLFRLTGPNSARTMHTIEGEMLTKYLAETGQTYRPDAYYKVLGFNLITSYYPAWLERDGHCRIRDPFNVADWDGGIRRVSTAPTPAPTWQAITRGEAQAQPRPVVDETGAPLPVAAGQALASVEPPRDPWLDTIPDYEMRLQARADAINNSLIGSTRVLWGLGVLLLTVVLFLARSANRLNHDLRVLGGGAADRRPDWIDRLRILRAEYRKSRIEAHLGSSHADPTLKAEATRLASELAALRARHDV
ncbi:hypothetical protein A6A05_00640 [Magnetospirillum moscoviense]|uniref:Uncharacterized protein n=1 Tax=Magnetospirillum moscoviense TaxID=1437059 RepID=A0A178MWK6_9PROT|nr:hypothetical protein A6A05_00640 [Magnetospirillum moscoviense]